MLHKTHLKPLLLVMLFLCGSALLLVGQSQPEAADDPYSRLAPQQATSPSEPAPSKVPTSSKAPVSKKMDHWVDKLMDKMEPGMPLEHPVRALHERLQANSKDGKILLYLGLGFLIIGLLVAGLAFAAFKLEQDLPGGTAGLTGCMLLLVAIPIGLLGMILMILGLVTGKAPKGKKANS